MSGGRPRDDDVGRTSEQSSASHRPDTRRTDERQATSRRSSTIRPAPGRDARLSERPEEFQDSEPTTSDARQIDSSDVPYVKIRINDRALHTTPVTIYIPSSRRSSNSSEHRERRRRRSTSLDRQSLVVNTGSEGVTSSSRSRRGSGNSGERDYTKVSPRRRRSSGGSSRGRRAESNSSADSMEVLPDFELRTRRSRSGSSGEGIDFTRHKPRDRSHSGTTSPVSPDLLSPASASGSRSSHTRRTSGERFLSPQAAEFGSTKPRQRSHSYNGQSSADRTSIEAIKSRPGSWGSAEPSRRSSWGTTFPSHQADFHSGSEGKRHQFPTHTTTHTTTPTPVPPQWYHPAVHGLPPLDPRLPRYYAVPRQHSDMPRGYTRPAPYVPTISVDTVPPTSSVSMPIVGSPFQPGRPSTGTGGGSQTRQYPLPGGSESQDFSAGRDNTPIDQATTRQCEGSATYSRTTDAARHSPEASSYRDVRTAPRQGVSTSRPPSIGVEVGGERRASQGSRSPRGSGSHRRYDSGVPIDYGEKSISGTRRSSVAFDLQSGFQLKTDVETRVSQLRKHARSLKRYIDGVTLDADTFRQGAERVTADRGWIPSFTSPVSSSVRTRSWSCDRRDLHERLDDMNQELRRGKHTVDNAALTIDAAGRDLGKRLDEIAQKQKQKGLKTNHDDDDDDEFWRLDLYDTIPSETSSTGREVRLTTSDPGFRRFRHSLEKVTDSLDWNKGLEELSQTYKAAFGSEGSTGRIATLLTELGMHTRGAEAVRRREDALKAECSAIRKSLTELRTASENFWLSLRARSEE